MSSQLSIILINKNNQIDPIKIHYAHPEIGSNENAIVTFTGVSIFPFSTES